MMLSARCIWFSMCHVFLYILASFCSVLYDLIHLLKSDHNRKVGGPKTRMKMFQEQKFYVWKKLKSSQYDTQFCLSCVLLMGNLTWRNPVASRVKYGGAQHQHYLVWLIDSPLKMVAKRWRIPQKNVPCKMDRRTDNTIATSMQSQWYWKKF